LAAARPADSGRQVKKLHRFRKEESGQGMTEYALILAGIAMVVLVAVLALGQQLDNFFTGVSEQISLLFGS
jgi:Flp pilus assembly pilin Flp